MSVCVCVCLCLCVSVSVSVCMCLVCTAKLPTGGTPSWRRMVSSANALSSSIFLTLRQRDCRWRRRLGRGGLQVSSMSTVHCHNGSMGGRRCLSARIQLCVISLRLRVASSSQISTVTRARLSLRFLPVPRESDIRPTCGVSWFTCVMASFCLRSNTMLPSVVSASKLWATRK